eukprot:10744462-Lingulodinium_polyedra.AAC.1
MRRMRFPAAFRNNLAPTRWVRAGPSRWAPGPLTRLGKSVRLSILWRAAYVTSHAAAPSGWSWSPSHPYP